jgi:signal transduction histidine kinase
VLNAKEALGTKGGAIQVRTELRLEPGNEAAGVWINPAPAGPAVCLVVEDTGSGMSREVLERAFDPFFTTHLHGRGLGLSAALGILQAHNAGLWVDTEEGRGTTFRIHFPPSKEDGPPGPAAAPPEDAARSKAILLVDDQETLL